MTEQAPSGMRLSEPLARLLGTRTAGGLATLGLVTVGDLLRHYPRKYGRPGSLTDLSELTLGNHVAVLAEVRTATIRPMHSRGGFVLEATVTDGRDLLDLTFFAKRAGMLRPHEDRLRPGRTGLFTGTVRDYRGRRQLTHPDYVIVGVDAGSEEEAVIEGTRPIPLYPASARVPTWRIARSVRVVLDPLTEADVPDPIPTGLLKKRGLGGLLAAFRDIHLPADDVAWMRGQARLRYEEALVLQVALARRRAAARERPSRARVHRSGGLLDAFDANLPFPLTPGQEEVGRTIAADIGSTVAMHRLLQGDVGAGKTLVALRAMLQVVDGGGQAALVAPTEVLAWQHATSIAALLGDLGEAGRLGAPENATRVALLTGSLGARERREASDAVASGAAGIVVGTHALFEESVEFADVGLVVIDEQHRFGVEQRDVFRTRGEAVPHMLVMTATPIPRTVAMTVFGDLDTSTLTDKPMGRADTVTHIIPSDNAAWMARAWARVREEVTAGGRAFVVCARIEGDTPEDGDIPEVEDGEIADGGAAAPMPILHSVDQVASDLAAMPVLSGIGIEVVHGRLRSDQKDAAMARFTSGEAPVLVCTTVIEVGVDVSEATVMVVLDADHFGLSQLHQLRGRIGRGSAPSICLLVSASPEGTLARQRLDALVDSADGFVLAERDLELRREGDVLGTAQSGGRNSLKLLSVMRDQGIIAEAREDARTIIDADPDLAAHPALAHEIERWIAPASEAFLERS